MDTDVLVVGAGPVGMTLALTLCKFGARVTIVDREQTTGKYTRAAILWSRTLEVLDLLGIADDWKEGGVPITHFHFEVNGQRADLDLAHVRSHYSSPLGFGQDITEELLDKHVRASSADYRRGISVKDIVLSSDQVSAVLETTEGTTSSITAQWVVGCDGSQSVVREATGIARQGVRNAGIQLIQGDVRVSGPVALEPGMGYLSSRTTDALLFILPIKPDGHYRVLCAVPDDGATEPPTLEYLQTLARLSEPGIVLSDPVWLNRFRTQQMIADTYRSGRAFLAGDAAHVWIPIGGQGMNVGMQDAFDLGWKLGAVLSETLPEAVLDTYTTERRPVGEGEIALTSQMFHVVLQNRNPLDAMLRSLMPHVIGFAPVAERAITHFSELDVRYPESRIVVDESKGGGPRPGERAPDAFLARPDTGERLRLFDLYRTGKWTVLAWCKEDKHWDSVSKLIDWCSGYPVAAYMIDGTPDGVPIVKSMPLLRDRSLRASELYGVRDPVVHIVRPDGVIAYRGPIDTGKVTAFMDSLFGKNGQC